MHTQRVTDVVGISGVLIAVRPVTLYPGGSAESIVYVHGYGVRVVVSATPSDSYIEVVEIEPASGKAPLRVKITIAASPNARPGVYWVDVAVLDAWEKRALASSRIPVTVSSSPVVEQVLKDVDRLRRIYSEMGIQYATVYALSRLNAGISFSDIKALYILIANRRVGSGSVGDLLKRLLKKGILKRVDGLYYLNMDPEVAKTIIDIKRARNGLRGASRMLQEREERSGNGKGAIVEIPAPVKRALSIVKKLLAEDYWMAVDFAAHVLLGVRKTGAWLLWFNDYFVYRERKTGFLHYFRSSELSGILKKLELKPGLMAEHENHPSTRYVIELYGSYANARRIHYMLKQLGWFSYGEPLLLELGEDYISVRGLSSNSTLLSYGNTNQSRLIKAVVYSGEHVDEENEDTYFHRPSNLY